MRRVRGGLYTGTINGRKVVIARLNVTGLKWLLKIDNTDTSVHRTKVGAEIEADQRCNPKEGRA